jgi:hypothetical protein
MRMSSPSCRCRPRSMVSASSSPLPRASGVTQPQHHCGHVLCPALRAAHPSHRLLDRAELAEPGDELRHRQRRLMPAPRAAGHPDIAWCDHLQCPKLRRPIRIPTAHGAPRPANESRTWNASRARIGVGCTQE